MHNLFLDVVNFHKQYKLPIPDAPELLSDELQEFRVKFLVEELQEYIEAHNNKDLTKAADALLDLVYVAMGTAVFMGIPFNDCWAHVQHANMTGKIRAENADESKRGSTYDVVKLPWFEAPDEKIRKTLIEFGAQI